MTHNSSLMDCMSSDSFFTDFFYVLFVQITKILNVRGLLILIQHPLEDCYGNAVDGKYGTCQRMIVFVISLFTPDY